MATDTKYTCFPAGFSGGVKKLMNRFYRDVDIVIAEDYNESDDGLFFVMRTEGKTGTYMVSSIPVPEEDIDQCVEKDSTSSEYSLYNFDKDGNKNKRKFPTYRDAFQYLDSFTKGNYRRVLEFSKNNVKEYYRTETKNTSGEIFILPSLFDKKVKCPISMKKITSKDVVYFHPLEIKSSLFSILLNCAELEAVEDNAEDLQYFYKSECPLARKGDLIFLAKSDNVEMGLVAKIERIIEAGSSPYHYLGCISADSVNKDMEDVKTLFAALKQTSFKYSVENDMLKIGGAKILKNTNPKWRCQTSDDDWD